MNAATTLAPAYYAPLNSSRSASGASADQEVWLDEALEGTNTSNWCNQYDSARSYVQRSVALDNAHVLPRAALSVTSGRTSLSESLRQVYVLQSLRQGWNGYDALRPAGEAVRHAQRWLEAQWTRCHKDSIPWYAPNVTADAEGNVVLEWWAEDRTLSLYFTSDDEDGSRGRTAEYLKFGRRGGPLAGLREQGTADTPEEAATLMGWFGE